MFFKKDSKFNKKLRIQGKQEVYGAELIAIEQGLKMCPLDKNVTVITYNKATINIIEDTLKGRKNNKELKPKIEAI